MSSVIMFIVMLILGGALIYLGVKTDAKVLLGIGGALLLIGLFGIITSFL